MWPRRAGGRSTREKVGDGRGGVERHRLPNRRSARGVDRTGTRHLVRRVTVGIEPNQVTVYRDSLPGRGWTSTPHQDCCFLWIIPPSERRMTGTQEPRREEGERR